MIKKFFHYLCFAAASVLWVVLLAFIFQVVMLLLFKIDPLAVGTYKGLSEYWNRGGVLKGKDIVMLLIIFAYLPLCVYGCYKLYHYKYILQHFLLLV